MSGAAPDAFTAFLQRGIGPKAGMWRIPLPTQSYEHPSLPLSAEKLLNLMIEAEPTEARNAQALISTGGLALNLPAGTFGFNQVIAVNTDLPGFTYVLTSDLGTARLYRLTDPTLIPPAELICTAPAIVYDMGESKSTMMETIAVGVAGIALCVPPNVYVGSHTDATLALVTGATMSDGSVYPGARSVTYLDGYFVFGALAQTSNFFASLLFDPGETLGLNFGVADAVPNVLRRVWTVNREIWLTGEGGIEIWYDQGGISSTGAVGFPFARQTGGFIASGPRSVRSCAIGSNGTGTQSLWWISLEGWVMQSSGYAGLRRSTPAIEAKIQAAGAAAILASFCFSDRGHNFYAVTINVPGGGAQTLVYDTTTDRWHNRSSSINGSAPWLPNCAGRIGGFSVFGGENGSLFQIVPVNQDDDGIILLRQFTLPVLWSRQSRQFNNRLEIEMEIGTLLGSPQGDVTMTWSNDGGLNYTGGPRSLSTGTLGQTEGRVVATRMGSSRQRVYRFGFTGNATIYGVDADITQPMASG